MECALVVSETLVNQPEVTPRPPQSLPDDTIVILELLFFFVPRLRHLIATIHR